MALVPRVLPSLTIATVACAVIAAAFVGRWVERQFSQSDRHLRIGDWIEVWLLRGAGMWVVFWLLMPLSALGQVDDAQQRLNAQQILINSQRIQTVESRLALIEGLRLDARLALLEDTRDEVRTTRQWVFGIVGGVIIIVITQILAVLGRPRERMTRGS